MKQPGTDLLVAVAGQPNCGKSTIFNVLTGARQHVANYPGVTVEKKWGRFKVEGNTVELVDLPGTYSLTSYTQEERIARDFVLREKPGVIVAVVDASNLSRSLYLVFQLLELGRPMVLCLNMMDVAQSRGLDIDVNVLAQELGMPVVPTVGRKGLGRAELIDAIANVARHTSALYRPRPPVYGEGLETLLERIGVRLDNCDHLTDRVPRRWLAVKLMENDQEAKRIVLREEGSADPSAGEGIVTFVDTLRREFIDTIGKSPEKVIAAGRYKRAGEIVRKTLTGGGLTRRTLTDRVDSVVLHPILAPIVLAGILLAFYQITMVYGAMLADWFFPFLQAGKEFVAGLWPASSDPIRNSLLQSLTVSGLVGGVVAILYYVPIVLVLFGLIAILEDSGYMARIAFIMDRILRQFGLHGQSTLPLILGGVVVGGCAVPGVMATRAMKDEKARMVTILIMPLMNCMAKIPFYVLIVGIFFTAHQGLVLFGISVFSFIVALAIAKLFSRYLVRGEAAPFVMELPTYHIPTVRGVIRRAIERVWLFVKKIVTIVAAVMVGVWFLVTFPGIGLERELHYDQLMAQAHGEALQHLSAANPFAAYLKSSSLPQLIRFKERVREVKQDAGKAPEERAELEPLAAENPSYFLIANNGVGLDGSVNAQAKKAALSLKRLERSARKIARERRKEIIDTSWAGQIGRAFEPVSMLAGFNWRINIAIISSFAAKESLVGTLGAIYSVEEGGEAGSLSQSIEATESGWTVRHALAILVFVALFPPCLATLIMIKNETGSVGWMLFATVYPIVIGFVLACLVYNLTPVFPGYL